MLAAATAFAEGREDVAREVLGELDPTVLRVAGPGSGARAALATARQRVSGTEGSRPVLAGLRAAEASFVELVEATAAPAPTHAELLEAAAWLGARRDLPEALVGD